LPESRPGVAAGLVPATPNRNAQSNNNRGGRDKPGHHLAGEAAYIRLTGIRSGRHSAPLEFAWAG